MGPKEQIKVVLAAECSSAPAMPFSLPALSCLGEMRVIPGCLHNCTLSRAPLTPGKSFCSQTALQLLGVTLCCSRVLGQDHQALLPTRHLCMWVQWKWKHRRRLRRNHGWDVCHGLGSSVTLLRAGRGTTARACTKMLCWGARAPTQLYSQGVNTELGRCSRAPKQAQTCPGLSVHLATGCMRPLHCQNHAKTPGHPWLLILVLPKERR